MAALQACTVGIITKLFITPPGSGCACVHASARFAKSAEKRLQTRLSLNFLGRGGQWFDHIGVSSERGVGFVGGQQDAKKVEPTA